MMDLTIDQAVSMINKLEVCNEGQKFQSMDMESIDMLVADGHLVTIHSTEISDINGHTYIVTVDLWIEVCTRLCLNKVYFCLHMVLKRTILSIGTKT